jgi:O-antigen ligase
MSGYIERSVALSPPTRARSARLKRQVLVQGKTAYALSLLFLVVVYTCPAVLMPSLEALAPAQLVGGLAVGAVLYQKIRNAEGVWFVSPNSHLLVAFLWAAALSCLTAAWPRLSVLATLDLIKYVLIYFVIVNTATTAARLLGVTVTMVIAGLFPTLGALHRYFAGNVARSGRLTWVGIFGNSNDLAYALVLLVPLSVALAGVAPRWSKPLFWAAIPAYVATIFLTYSRGSLLALLVVLVLVGFRHKAPVVRAATFGLVAASALFVLLFWSRQEGFTNLSDFTFNQRLVTIRTGIDMFLDDPLTGMGIGGSVAAFKKYAPPDLQFAGALKIHNTFVESLSEVGFFGCAFYVLFVASGIYQARKRAHEFATSGPAALAPVLEGVEIALWGFIVCGLFGPYMMSWFPYLLIGVAAAAQKLSERQQPGDGTWSTDEARL